MKMTRYYFYSLLLCLISVAPAAGQSYVHQDFNWDNELVYGPDSTPMWVPVSPVTTPDPITGMPYWSHKVPLKDNQELLLDPSVFLLLENLDAQKHGSFLQHLPISAEPLEARVSYSIEKKKRYAYISLPAIEKEEDGSFRILTHLTLKWSVKDNPSPALLGKGPTAWKTESLLKDGQWAKVIFKNSGVYRLTLAEIQNFGLSASGQDVSKIRMYAYAGGMLPEYNKLTEYDDLEEMAIEVRDKNSNGIFDGDDDVLFFVYGPDELKFDSTSKTYFQQNHYYSPLSAAFITVGAPGGKRIPTVGFSNQTPTYTTTTYDEILHSEEDKYNLIKSGKVWYGKEFGRTTDEHTFTFDLPGQVPGDVIIQTRASGRSGGGSVMKATIDGNILHTHSFPGVPVEWYAGRYASEPDIQKSTFTANGPLDVTLTYIKPSNDSRAWLDFVEIIYRKKLNADVQFRFRDANGTGAGGVTRYNLSGGGYQVWDLSDPLNITRINLAVDGSFQYFVASSEKLTEYVALKNENFLTIGSFEKVANQNIHGEKNIDYIIIAHADFMGEAQRLADFHTAQNGLKVLVVEPAKVYNEFSSGVPDISALRNMVRYFYETATPGNEPKYLLMFGDASYDYKNVLTGNTNFVPTFETDNSVDPVGSFCSDDFFGLLDETEGSITDTQGKVDIGIGRLPVRKVEEARAMVDKIIRYHDPAGLGEWRNVVALLTDDEDGNVHMNDAETYADVLETSYTEYNVRKIYSDAYKQTTVGNGQRYPDVIKEVDRAFNDGALIVNYSGHGGEVQLGEEKYVDIPQLQSWHGGSKLPLFITATCEFTRFDDPARQSAGELVMLNPGGGGIGLLTTVRLVYSYPNRLLNSNFYSSVFNYPPEEVPALGDLFVATKNATQSNVINCRSFTLIGDPALKLAYPKHKVTMTALNGVDPAVNSDTLKALSHIVIEGEIRNHQDQLLTGFNGKIYTTVFANKQKVKTLANDPNSNVQEFEAYNSVAYKGIASVKNGIFRVEFMLPRDLPFEIGKGKISFYAENGTEDANGESFMTMSPELDPTATLDNEGPKIRVFMNDSNFLFGGITNEHPYIYALVYDESGINTTGVGIGRDISGTLDFDSKKVIVLNEYYQANIDDFTRGIIYYPLTNLSEGRHHLKVKVWDVHNNSAEGSTEFVVAPSVQFAIDNLINYPNPFTTTTTFSFEHNKQGKDLSMELRIYDTQGKLVTTMAATEKEAGSRVKSLVWNATRNGHTPVSPGVYVFKLVVKTSDGEEAELSSTIVYLSNP